MVESESELVIETPETTQEEMIAKSRVNDIVKREKAAAADKVRREMEALHAQEVERLRAQQPVSREQSPTSNEDLRAQMRQLMMEEAQKFEEEEEKRRYEAEQAELKQQLEKSAHQYLLNVEQGKSEFPDFDEVMKDFDMRNFSGVALLAGQMENTAAIMHELAQNPGKVAQLHILAQQSPLMAEKEMKKLAASISKNQQAANNNIQTNAPLSRLKSSTVAGADTGQMGLKDFKNADWLKV